VAESLSRCRNELDDQWRVRGIGITDLSWWQEQKQKP